MDLQALDEFFSTPAILLPNMGDEEWQEAIDKMIALKLAARDFVDGKLSPSEFEEVLFFHGHDPIIAAEDFERGLKLNGFTAA